jgi:hypothetical protein
MLCTNFWYDEFLFLRKQIFELHVKHELLYTDMKQNSTDPKTTKNNCRATKTRFQ